MNTFARLASAVIAAAVFVVPASAMAVTKHKKAESAFPMKAEVFKKIVDGKIGKMKGHFEKGVKKRSLSHNQKADLDKTLEVALKELHSTVDKVSADGVVTKDEAKQVKRVSDQLRTKVREELRGKHASTKAKGQKPAKGKVAKKAKKAKKRAAEKAQKS